MAGKVTVRSSMDVVFDTSVGLRDWTGQPTAFEDTMVGKKGPAPGAFSVSTAGTDVDLTQFNTPGWCRIRNLDPTNKVHVGVFDPETVKFYPIMVIPPLTWVDFKLSDELKQEYGTGTGTTGAGTNRLRLQASAASCNVDVSIFEA
jgi:hypothetical protein